VTALQGDLSSIRGLKASIKKLPLSVAHDVSQRAAPAMTDLTRSAYTSGRSVYGDARPLGADGRPLTLQRTGAVARALKFTANGTIVRCVLGPKYARYLIGKYGILPNGALPVSWSRRLGELVKASKAPLVGP
jgi:hypothetical protein